MIEYSAPASGVDAHVIGMTYGTQRERKRLIVQSAVNRSINWYDLTAVERIIRALLVAREDKKGGFLSAVELSRAVGYKWSTRLSDLRKLGFPIEKAEIPGKSFSKYRLEIPGA